MIIKSLLIKSLVIFLQIINSMQYTNEFRTIKFHCNNSSFIIDPITADVYNFVQKLSKDDKTNYDNKEIYYSIIKQINDYLSSDLSLLYYKFTEVNYDLSLGQWLQGTDLKTITKFYETKREINSLLYHNKYSIRMKCYNISYLVNHKDCSFLKIAYEYNVQSFLMSFNQSDYNIDELISFAEGLFNNQLYDYAEAICYYIFKLENVEKMLFSDNYIDKFINQRRHSLFVILSEVSKLNGYLRISTTFSSIIVQMYSIYIVRNHISVTDDINARIILAKLRMLLTIPNIPQDRETSLVERHRMVEDLTFFHNNLLTNNIKFPLKILTSIISATPFHLSHQGLNDKNIQIVLSNIFTSLCPDLFFIGDNIKSVRKITTNFESFDKPLLKIGFISSYFFHHSIGRIFLGLLLSMNNINFNFRGLNNTNYYKIEIKIYFIDRNIPSETNEYDLFNNSNFQYTHHDEVTDILKNTFHSNYIRLPDNITVIRNKITTDKLDFLFFADIGMDFSTYTVAFSRLATYQAVWWGHPITTGIDSIDFFISLDNEILEADSHYTEQLIRMDTINISPLQNIHKSQYKKEELFTLLGIPIESKICLVLGRLFKLHPDFDKIVISLLASTETYYNNLSTESEVYVVFISENNYNLNHQIFERLKQFLIDNGNQLSIATRMNILSKIKFFHMDYYNDLLTHSRIVLDTYPYGGCLTTHDALWKGIPMVTLPSDYIRGRFTMSMYKQMKFSDLIASSLEHMIEIAFQLIIDEIFWQKISKTILNLVETELLQNQKVAIEWLNFVLRLFS